MKVTHIVWSLTLGGIETMLVNIANAQQALVTEVSVVIVNDLYDESLLRAFNPGIEIVFLHRKRHSKNPWFIVKCQQVLKRLNPDVIHLHHSRLFGILLGRRLSREACVTLHALPTGSVRRGGWLSKIFPIINVLQPGNVGYIDQVPCVFAISEAVQEALQKKYGVSSVVVNNGIITSNFHIRPLRPAQQPLRIVQVSRLDHDKKGQDLLIEATARMKGMFAVDFIGDGNSLEYLQSLTERLGVSSNVRFLGKQTQAYIAENLCQYDLFVQPSRYEGFGLTVAEAMAAQVPVLVSAGQGPAEVTCGDTYGWTFENGSVDDLVRVLTYIQAHYQEALDKVQQARRYVIATYDVSVTAKKYLEEYKKMKNKYGCDAV